MTGLWKLVVPTARKNYVPNPSFEEDATGWTTTASGTAAGTRTRVNTGARYGFWAYQFDITSGSGSLGAYASCPDFAEFVAGDVVRMSAWLTIPAGTTGVLNIVYDQGAGATSIDQDIAGPYDGRYEITTGTLTGTLTQLEAWIRIKTATGTTGIFDGVMIEKGATAGTYLDGDQEGCYWLGEHHNSGSQRPVTSRAGGVPTNLDDYAFYVTGVAGMGAARVSNIMDNLPLQDGGLFRDYRVSDRTFTLIGELVGSTRADLHDKRRALLSAIEPRQEPILLEYTGSGETLRMKARYAGGLEWSPPEGFTERLTLRFECEQPHWTRVEQQVTALTLSQTLTGAYFIGRKLGVWQEIGGDVNAPAVYKILVRRDGLIYIGGTFTLAGGVANTRGIALYDPDSDTYSALGTGLDDGITWDMSVAPNDDLVIVGSFTGVGGVLNTGKVAVWDVSAGAWISIVTTAPNNSCEACVYDQQGNLYIGGSFTTFDGAAAAYIKKYDGSSWSNPYASTGPNSSVLALVVSAHNILYAGGTFTTIDGTTVNRIAVYNGSVWSPLLTTIDAVVQTLAQARDGSIYAGGDFGGANDNILRWDGALDTLNGGIGGAAEEVWYIYEHENGLVYVGGILEMATDDPLNDTNCLIWTGTEWIYPDFYSDEATFAIGSHRLFDLMVSKYNVVGTAYRTSVKTTITHNGTRDASPLFYFHYASGTGTFRLQWIENYTTGQKIFLDYDLQIGEIVTMDLRPQSRSVKSSMYGDIWRAVKRSSDFATFKLVPGANEIIMFANINGPTVEAAMAVPLVYWGADGY